MGKSVSYTALEALSRQFAGFLQGELRLTRGACVALMMPNCLQYPIAMFAILRAGYTVVNVNPLYTARELEHQLRDAGCEAIVIVENFAHTLQEVLPRTSVRHVVVTGLGDMLGFPKSPAGQFCRAAHQENGACLGSARARDLSGSAGARGRPCPEAGYADPR